MNKLIFACSLLLSLSYPAHAGQANTPNQFSGEWEGAGTQSDGSHWSIRVNSRPNGYFIDYPSLVCGGVWTLLKTTESSLVFKETLTYGIERCVDHGEIVINHVAPNKVSYAWSSAKSKITAAGNLTRKMNRANLSH
ncbi:MAG: hypothetical protein LUO95_04775 [Methylococcaceae bacterium]|nr:hypothetical protein [Methylococcaceae bacterium]